MKNKCIFAWIWGTKAKILRNNIIDYGKIFSKKFLPKFLQIELIRFFDNGRYKLRISIIKYLYEQLSKTHNHEINKILQYLKKNPLTNIPYNFSNADTSNISVYSDDSLDMKYILFENKKLYFPRGWQSHHVSGFCKNILKEQNIKMKVEPEKDIKKLKEQK
jgi:hypothetical protein